ncbi:MAG: ACP S-malonyltransferase [Candidatus Omnitrophica bacterium]|nr:ACP S-malonyltransferase [Candidatus Omnitrophota bacterium]
MSKMAVIFPGQGSQYEGMGKDLFDNFHEAKALFDKADSILGQDISSVCFSGSDLKLKDTLYQQLAIFLVSSVNFQILKSKKDIQPLFYAGLSLGEYTALYAGGVLSFQDALVLVKKRAEFMAQAARNNPSCMYAVLGVNSEDLEEGNSGLFYIANLNCPGQVVISLDADKKEAVRQYFEVKQAKRIVELEVSGGFHSPFMKEAEANLREVAYSLNFRDAEIPIVSNVDAVAYRDKDQIRKSLIEQLTKPVLWAKSVEYMRKEGVTLFYEVGPSKVLKGILRKIDSTLKVVNFGSMQDFESALV